MTSGKLRNQRVVLHLDMDAFYAAVEERDNPQFAGLPIVVGANPQNGFGRGVVSTANYVARKYGIKSAMPITWAYRACPSAIFLPCDFKRYSKASKSIMEIVRSFDFPTEQVSVDECYLDLTSHKLQVTSYEAVEKIARQIKQAIWSAEKLTTSIGIGPNKLIAKVASDFNKPDGLMIVEPARVQKFLDPLSVRVLPGVGPKTGHVLLQMGIVTVKDLKQTYLYKLKERFGKHGTHLWEMANGRDDRPVTERHETKSVGRQSTFWKDTSDPRVIYDLVIEMLKESLQEVKYLGLLGRTLTITVRYAWFETHTSQESLKVPLDFNLARKLTLKLLMPYFNGKKVRLVGVRISGFSTSKNNAPARFVGQTLQGL